ncbi:Zn-ribbon domain-containing OB-fold protein [Bordetella sp. N]|uniref:Zn-ribbon domain-containing OB-fold protein n=1 Tax=Bordetella sp. N TaxID=1746199 RepID=UPI00070A3CF0|nr:Zn-ribbon domain-containing OB-fold protein [Bordetella sp. N]ALM83437.1 DNA-binding protein [Bordetella sp. N]
MTQPSPGPQTGADLHYKQALAQGQFLIQRCDACARAVFFPRMICPHCGSDKLAWQTPSGRGTVYSTTVVRRKPDAGGDYNVALVDLEEGARLMSRVDGIAPADVHIGMPVQAKVLVRENDGLLIFVPREGKA